MRDRTEYQHRYRTEMKGATPMNTYAIYYGASLKPDETLTVDTDIEREFLKGILADIKRDNRRNGLTDRIAQIDTQGNVIRWLN